MLVKDIMTRDVITVSPDSSLKEVGRLLKEKRISGMPVVDSSGNIVGMVTVDDILRLLEEIYQWQELERKSGMAVSDLVGREQLNIKVQKIMTKTVFTVDENKPLLEALRLVFTKKIHTIPVTSDGKLAGVIGKHDLVYSCF